MIQSMTGYGRAEAAIKETVLAVEIRSVNSRHCSVAVRLPRILSLFEEEVKKKIQTHFERGRIDVVVTVSGATESKKCFALNLEAAQSYYEILKKLQQSLGLSGEIDIALMSQFRELITVTESDEPEVVLEGLLNLTLVQAMTALEKMRKTEGKALAADLRTRLQELSERLSVVKGQEKEVILSRQQRLQARVAELTSGVSIDPIRLAQEIALFAERSDVSEERTRLSAHMDQFKKILKTGGAVGRSLDFLLQEMFRETNTLSAKSNDQSISMAVVAMKSELEKMREQVQNIA